MGKNIFTENKKKILVKRLISLCLAMVLSLCAFPEMKVLATEVNNQTEQQDNNQQNVDQQNEESDEETSESDDNQASDDKESAIQNASWETPTINGSSDPTLPAPSVEEMIAATQSVPAEDNLYALTVATGIKSGDTVHYFAVRYTDGNGANRTKYLFPHDDAFKVSYDYMNEKGGTNDTVTKRHEILEQLGYKVNEPTEPTALSTWSVDEYLFKADWGLTGVNSIEVFMTGGSWSVQGMAVSKVTSVAGYGEYGYYSGKYFFGLGKKRISELTKKTTGSLTLSARGDTLINIGGATSSYFELTAVNDDSNETDTPFDDLYSIRIDFADKLDSGIESYLKTSANDLNPASADLAEDLAVQIEYKDKNGWTRNVTMPVVLSAVGQYLETGDEVRTYGLCQRGETIAFTGCLPELSTVVSTKVYAGSAARTTLIESGGIDVKDATAAETKGKMQEALDADYLEIAGLSIYQGTCRISNINDGADSVTGNSYKAVSTAYSFLEPAPFRYFTTTNENGMRINPGGSEELKLKNYDTKDPLIAATNKKNFLIRLHTDSMEKAATRNNIYVRLTYSTSSGADRGTERFDVKKKVQEYLGYWPTTTVQKSEFAYTYETQADGTAEFPVELTDVTGISSVEVSLGNGEDGWQMAGVSVAYIPSIGHRRVYLRPTSAQGDASPFQIVRTTERADIPPFPLGIKKYFDPNNKPCIWDVNSGKSTGADELDYSTIRYSMTYDQTQQNLGFVNTEKIYDVMVGVASDSDTSNANGDSGSDNQFYFQLLFKNGNSAMVLANQQLSADGFRAGYNENFTIAVNRDYGALTGVRIIPEDVSEDSEIFDKLNIEKIVVTEQSNGGAAMQYIIDNVGWIGIDYHDKAENSSIKGREGRMMSEIASKYNVSSQRHVVNLLCEVMTLPWDIQDYIQVEGSISCEMVYIDTNEQPQTIGFDVVARMAQYMNKSAISYEPPGNTNDSTIKYYKNMTTVSDPEWMLRPNHTDRFILPSIPNLQSIKSITFYATSRNNKPGQWVIGDVAISEIIDDGPVMITADNEYYRDMNTLPLCRMKTDKEKVSMLLPAGATQSLTLEFTDNQLVWNEEEAWVSPVTRIPDSTADTMNIYVYPSADSRVLDGITVDFAVQYAIPFQNPLQENGKLTPIASGTENACFYASGVRATGMATLNSLTLRCMNANMGFDHAIVQQIREGVVVSNFYINLNNSSALLGVTAKPSSLTGPSEPREQVMYLSFGQTTKEATLFSEENDIAVSFKYRTSLDQGAGEYYSPYVYLTDVGVGKLYPGQMVEVPFNVPYVTEITGYRIISFGGIEATVEGAMVANYSYTSKTEDENTGEIVTNDLTRLGVYSMVDITDGSVIVPLTVTNTVTEKPVTAASTTGANSVNPLDITFTTAGALSTGESGTDAAVQMTFNYRDYNGAIKSRTLADARLYIQGAQKTFKTGNDARIRLFLPECSELLSIGILPYDEGGNANWAVNSVSGSLALGDSVFTRMVNDTFMQSGGGKIYIKEVVMNTYYAIDSGGAQQVTNHIKSMVLGPNQVVRVSVTFGNGNGGFNVVANWIVNDTETDVTSMTIAQRTDTSFNFTVPKNITNSPQTYSIVVSSAENPSVKDVINVTVNGKEIKDAVNNITVENKTVYTTPETTPENTPSGGGESTGGGDSGSGGSNDPSSGGNSGGESGNENNTGGSNP